MGRSQIQIARHRADNGKLLPVLLAEKCPVRLHLIEKLAHHCCHAIKVPGPVRAAEIRANPAHTDRAGKPLRIHFLNCGSPQERNAFSLQHSRILGQLARISVEILALAKLRRIDKNGCGNVIAMLLCMAHQGQMPFVQSAHCRHQSQCFFALAQCGRSFS